MTKAFDTKRVGFQVSLNSTTHKGDKSMHCLPCSRMNAAAATTIEGRGLVAETLILLMTL